MSEPNAAEATHRAVAASILDSYVRTAPSYQNAVDIFAGEWSSKFPPPFGNLNTGTMPLFNDRRMIWALERFGGVLGQNILDLGPLEGGHAFMLERAGAACITSIEANSRAYLKCLIAKEILNLSRTRFLCGDFVAYLENSPQQFDIIVASGVLYHMKDPTRLLELIGRHTCRAYLWTHYYDAGIIASKPHLQVRFQNQTVEKMGTAEIVHYRHNYMDSQASNAYTGGNDQYSVWLSRDGLMTALWQAGFTDFEFSFEMPDHPHGPALSLIAVRK